MIGDNRTFVIAEAGINHNGSLPMALELIDSAARAGADAVKFQTFQALNLASAKVAKAAYQAQNTGGEETQQEMLRKLELDRKAHVAIAEHCQARDIAFMSTPFDLDSLALLDEFAMPAIKVSSGDITAAPLLLEIAKRGRPVILSTGMSTLSDIEQALGVLAFGFLLPDEAPSRQAFEAAYCSADGRAVLEDRVVLLHCVSEYPSPLSEVNLRVLDTLRHAFGLKVGYSDHTMGTSASLAAVARGACVIEKHFTIDRAQPGPDHRASLEPDELRGMVEAIREIEQALGRPHKQPSPSEWSTRRATRRSLVAARPIKKGERFTPDNVAVKRAGGGVAPIGYWELIGTEARRDFAPDEPLQP